MFLLGFFSLILRIAATLPDLLKALQLMKFDWALECRVLQQLSVMVADLGTKQQVNVVEDAASWHKTIGG
jgi:hypothetical protein